MNKTSDIVINACADGALRLTNATSTGAKARTIRISLKQWRMFHAVVDSDSFVEAAEKLHVSQSSISHGLAKLQEQLGLALLTLRGRKAQITEAGKIVLERSRELVRNAAELEELAESLKMGWEPEVRLVVDPDFPSDILMRALRGFSSSVNNVRLSVREEAADWACQALLDDAVDFAVTAKVPPGYVSSKLVVIEYVPVAHAESPLFSLKRYVTIEDLRSQRQIVVGESNDYLLASKGSAFPHWVRPWCVSSNDRAIDALRERTGYAWLPKYKLQPWLEKNILRVLPMMDASSYTTCLYLVTGKSVRGNPCAVRFGDAMRTQDAATY